jgi:hypothetical protein
MVLKRTSRACPPMVSRSADCSHHIPERQFAPGSPDRKTGRDRKAHLRPAHVREPLSHHRPARRHSREGHRSGHRHAAVSFTLTAMMAVMMATATLHGRPHAGRAHHGIVFTFPATTVTQRSYPLSNRISKAPWFSAVSTSLRHRGMAEGGHRSIPYFRNPSMLILLPLVSPGAMVLSRLVEARPPGA